MNLLIILIQLFFIHPVNVDMTGIWTFQAPTAPPFYQEGEVHVSQDDDGGLTVEIVLGQYKIPTTNVKVDNNKLSFTLNVEGAYIPLSLEFDGKSFKGQADTPDGNVMLSGERKKE